MLFKEGTVPMQTRLVSGGSPIMTSPQKPVVSNTPDPPPASGTCMQASPAGACLHDDLQSHGGSTMNA